MVPFGIPTEGEKILIRLLSDLALHIPVFQCWISSSGSVHRNHFKASNGMLGHAKSAETRTKDLIVIFFKKNVLSFFWHRERHGET